MFGKLACCVTLVLAQSVHAQSPLDGLRDVRVAVSITLRGGAPPPIDSSAIAASIRSTLHAGGLRVTTADNAPLVFFGILVSSVQASTSPPITLYAVRYEYTLTENGRLERWPTITIPVSSWSSGGAVDVVSNPAAVTGAAQNMAIALSEKFNHARGVTRP